MGFTQAHMKKKNCKAPEFKHFNLKGLAQIGISNISTLFFMMLFFRQSISVICGKVLLQFRLDDFVVTFFNVLLFAEQNCILKYPFKIIYSIWLVNVNLKENITELYKNMLFLP